MAEGERKKQFYRMGETSFSSRVMYLLWCSFRCSNCFESLSDSFSWVGLLLCSRENKILSPFVEVEWSEVWVCWLKGVWSKEVIFPLCFKLSFSDFCRLLVRWSLLCCLEAFIFGSISFNCRSIKLDILSKIFELFIFSSTFCR